MFLGFSKHKDQQVNISFLPQQPSYLYILPTFPFLGESFTLPHFLKNKQNSNSHPLCKLREDPVKINQNYLFHIFVTDSILIQQYENVSGYSTRCYMLQKNRIGRQVGFFFFFTFLPLFFFYCIRRAYETLKLNLVKFKYSSHELRS